MFFFDRFKFQANILIFLFLQLKRFTEADDAALIKELKVTYLRDFKLWPYVGNPEYTKIKGRLPLRHFYNSMAVFPGANATYPHGILGMFLNDTPAYVPGPIPPPITADNDTDALRNGGFYLALSNALPLNRETRDLRPQVCKNVIYDISTLDDASIIINFFNEPISTLLRTLHSILNHTPPPLLREIILVDDHSDLPDLLPGNFLTRYIALLPKVKLIRHPERRGLVISRLSGIRAAKAPIVVVLDSHLEFCPGWLEPQLQRIKESPRSLVFPQIPSIDSRTFDYLGDYGIGAVLSFKWMMQERPYAVESPTSDAAKPSPTLAGGLFAVRRDVFWKLGGYDEQFTMWGAENVEMGFRYWLCHHRIESAPCSYVYHIFRKKGSGYATPMSAVVLNRLRTARLWTGKYFPLAKLYLFDSNVNPGSFDQMLELKERLKCKEFDWYLENVDSYQSLRSVESLQYIESIENHAIRGYCIDTLTQDPSDSVFGIFPCHHSGKTQSFVYDTKTKRLFTNFNEMYCLTTQFRIQQCQYAKKDILGWTIEGSTLRPASSPNMCLSANLHSSADKQLSLVECSTVSKNHLWTINIQNIDLSVEPLEFTNEYIKERHVTFFSS